MTNKAVCLTLNAHCPRFCSRRERKRDVDDSAGVSE